MQVTDGTLREAPPSPHAIELFDSDASRTTAVSAFISEGAERDQNIFLAIRAPQWALVQRRLDDGRLDEFLSNGQLVVVDARSTLDRILAHGVPDAGLFDAVLGSPIRQLNRQRPLRVYGELVDLLAAEGDFVGAQQLEDLWNGLAARERFTLLCGYSSAHFGDIRSAGVLSRLCRCHTEIREHAADELGSWLIGNATDGRSARS
jgi:hypothetical protein